MTNPIAAVDLFAFTSYRSYFLALSEAWRADGRSMQELAKRCGFASPNFVQQITAGKRNLTEAAATKAARQLHLKDTGRKYLVTLVRLSRAKDAGEAELCLRTLKRLVAQAKRSVADTSIFDHWLYGIVFELFKLTRVSSPADLAGLGLRLAVTEAQLRQAFDFLVQKRYLVELDGKWTPAELEFQPQNDVRRINSQQNHLKFFGLAQHRINDELDDREFQGLTFAVRESRMPASNRDHRT